jgi:hypothetical protein
MSVHTGSTESCFVLEESDGHRVRECCYVY